ncbi:hypothetical protein LTR09_005484 [Extremus antarcticus]|uniref:Uncharacterized protein n=1 Tax=Extremus antarcticus TaxID=702011 RepID=A0AAJ0DFX1_9PEZI|nr:hypothetical protein LTR09_005484 [Extremus antarcticus]
MTLTSEQQTPMATANARQAFTLSYDNSSIAKSPGKKLSTAKQPHKLADDDLDIVIYGAARGQAQRYKAEVLWRTRDRLWESLLTALHASTPEDALRNLLIAS